MQIDIKYVLIGQLVEQNATLTNQLQEAQQQIEDLTKELAEAKQPEQAP